MSQLILLRHGQSTWNKKNLFTGWVDVTLSKEGILEARKVKQQLLNIPINVVFTSKLIRSIQTALIVLEDREKSPLFIHKENPKIIKWTSFQNKEEEEDVIPVFSSEALNERMYGDLQGKNKKQIEQQFGKEQLQLWRRSYKTKPPGGESLFDTAQRTLPFFNEHIIPECQKGHNVLVSAHGNSLRSILMELDALSEEEIVSLNIATGEPIVYHFDNQKFTRKPL